MSEKYKRLLSERTDCSKPNIPALPKPKADWLNDIVPEEEPYEIKEPPPPPLRPKLMGPLIEELWRVVFPGKEMPGGRYLDGSGRREALAKILEELRTGLKPQAHPTSVKHAMMEAVTLGFEKALKEDRSPREEVMKTTTATTANIVRVCANIAREGKGNVEEKILALIGETPAPRPYPKVE